jgi:two-component system chemotaxis response regulator CheB
VAPPDTHLLIHRDVVRVVRGPHENGHRPAVDPLFRTAARWHGRRVVGVVLSGSLDDGTAGLTAIKNRRGTAVVQEPDEALFPSMPRSAVENVSVDRVLPLAEIAPALVRLAREPVEEGDEPMPDEMEMESDIDEFDLDANQADHHPGTPSGFAWPYCGGALWELYDGELIRFRCRVGHAWSGNGLLAEQAEALETALWTALRALEERAALSTRLAQRLRERGPARSAERFEEQAREAKQRAALLRRVLLSEPATNAEMPPESGAAPPPDRGGPPQDG